MYNSTSLEKICISETPNGSMSQPRYFSRKNERVIFNGLDYVRTYIDDLLIKSNKSLEDQINKLDKVFLKSKSVGFKVNAEKLFSARNELEYIDFKITREGIMPYLIKQKL